jgi:hypothetical protein
MKGGNYMKSVIALTAGLSLLLATRGRAADLGSIPWTESNIETLRTFDKAAVVGYLNEYNRTEGTPEAIKDSEVRQFRWVDLAGDGKYELALTASSGPCCVFLWLYWQERPGKLRFQSLNGAGGLADTIRDLNDDGTDEIIVYKDLVVYSDAQRFGWPAVYRLKKGKYVEASRDFSKFYDDEVLPNVEKEIGKAPNPALRARPIMERDKILRVLGRDPVAGLRQAREWAASSDPELIGDAIVVFRDIGGHQDDARAALGSWKRVTAQQRSGQTPPSGREEATESASGPTADRAQQGRGARPAQPGEAIGAPVR